MFFKCHNTFPVFYPSLPGRKRKEKKKNTLVSQPNELTHSASPKLARNVKVGDLVAPTL